MIWNVDNVRTCSTAHTSLDLLTFLTALLQFQKGVCVFKFHSLFIVFADTFFWSNVTQIQTKNQVNQVTTFFKIENIL